VILMHPWEAKKQRTGTGRMTALSLVDAEIIVDQSFDENPRFLSLIRSDLYHPLVLYPGKEAMTAETYPFDRVPKEKKLLIFLIDATWVLARKMMYRSSLLQGLPRLSFDRAYRSRFHIKTQPAEYCLSTIESTYYLIRELQDADRCRQDVSVEGLMDLFDELNRFQMACCSNRGPENKKGSL